MQIIKTACGSMGAMVLVTVVAGGCGETRDGDPANGSGGASAASSGGADGEGTGGKSGEGSGGEGSGGKGGELDCQVLSLGSGGGVYLHNCPDWFGQGGDGGAATETLCSAGGESGGDGAEPALALACAKVETIGFEQHLVKCLQPLAEELCADDHDQKVRACFAAKKPCGAEIEECGPLSTTCSSLSPGLCYWGMSEAREAQRDEELASCFAEPRQGESCDDTFFRCAWGL